MSQSDPSNKGVLPSVVIGASILLFILSLPVLLIGALDWFISPSDFIGGGGRSGGGMMFDAGLEPGKPAPVLVAEGWINGNAPTPEILNGKVVVIDAWASW
jgi:hypothetical protein